MKSVENQRIIKVKRYSENCRKDYLKISNENLQIAMYNLTTIGATKLYLYLVDNSNGYTMALYPCDFVKFANCSYDTYRRAFEELKNKGYIIETKKSNYYIFTEESIIDLPYPKQDMIQSIGEKDFEYDLEEAKKNIKENKKV